MTYRILFFTKNIMGVETSDRTVSFTKIFIDYGYMITKDILRLISTNLVANTLNFILSIYARQ